MDDDDPIAFARVTTRAVRTMAHGSGNELLAEQLADLANQTVWATIWKAPLDYQTREIRREAADLMRSTLEAIRFADCVIVMIDATAPFEKQDLTIADLIAREGRAIVFAVNKWDLLENKAGAISRMREKLDRLLPNVTDAKR